MLRVFVLAFGISVVTAGGALALLHVR